MDPVSPGQDAAPTSEDFSWTCGNDPHIYHISMISYGAYGQVHKVLSFEDVADS